MTAIFKQTQTARRRASIDFFLKTDLDEKMLEAHKSFEAALKALTAAFLQLRTLSAEWNNRDLKWRRKQAKRSKCSARLPNAGRTPGSHLVRRWPPLIFCHQKSTKRELEAPARRRHDPSELRMINDRDPGEIERGLNKFARPGNGGLVVGPI
jgi:hypothetical protein